MKSADSFAMSASMIVDRAAVRFSICVVCAFAPGTFIFIVPVPLSSIVLFPEPPSIKAFLPLTIKWSSPSSPYTVVVWFIISA